MPARIFWLLSLAWCAASACNGKTGGQAACGLTIVAASTLLLNEFAVPNQTLSTPPDELPPNLAVRVAAGPAYPAVAGRSGAEWVIGVQGSLPSNVHPAFGVLVVDPANQARGVMLYESRPVQGAPHIGSVAVGSTTVPLLGLQVDPARYEDPKCALFPDSVLR